MLFAATVPPPVGAGMTEQFGAIPVRAFGDTRLSAADFRVMGAVAYFDRLGRNGIGCFVDPRKLSEVASVLYQHISRHTKRLYEFGYLEISRRATDRRRRIYSLIYNEDQGVVTNSGDDLDDPSCRGDTVSSLGNKDTISGDSLSEKDTKPNSQAVDPDAEPAPKRSCKTYLRNPAKPCARGSKNRAADTPFARQGDRGGGNSRSQGHLMLPLKGGNQQTTKHRSEPDWNGWAAWIGVSRGLTTEQAWKWLLEEIDRIAEEKNISSIEAGVILDRELKKRRKATA